MWPHSAAEFPITNTQRVATGSTQRVATRRQGWGTGRVGWGGVGGGKVPAADASRAPIETSSLLVHRIRMCIIACASQGRDGCGVQRGRHGHSTWIDFARIYAMVHAMPSRLVFGVRVILLSRSTFGNGSSVSKQKLNSTWCGISGAAVAVAWCSRGYVMV